MMKNYLLIGLVFLILCCKKAAPIPAETQDGRGTFACRVDGELWMPHRKDFLSTSSVARYLSKEKTLFIGGRSESTDTGISFGISNYDGKLGEYIVDNYCADPPRIENNCANLNRNLYAANEGIFWTNKTYFGKVKITVHTSFFVSGTFEFEGLCCMNAER